MKNFVRYARYYDLLYKDKDYGKEVDYVNRLIRAYSNRRSKTLLDIGCGTGSHDIWFAKKGYRVTGIDRSPKMIAIARRKVPSGNGVKFIKSDASSFNLHRRFDVVVSLFHVMGYLADNKQFIMGLNNIRRHLKKNGLFIFDFWYGPAVLAQKPEKKIKVVSDEKIIVKRTAIPKLNFNENVVDVHYKNAVLNKNDRSVKIIKESHKMRYFFMPELDSMLARSGFNIIKSFSWPSLKKDLNTKNWNGVIVARKG